MSDPKTDGRIALTAPVRMIFPNLITAKPFMRDGKPQGDAKFGARFLFEPDHVDLKAIKQKAAAVAQAKWPGRELKTLAFPFASGDAQAEKSKAKGKDAEFMRGLIVLTARSKYEVQLSTLEGGKIKEIVGTARAAAASKFYGGAYVAPALNFVAYNGVGQNPDGVTAYLDMVLFVKDGPRIGGGGNAADVFKGYAGNYSDESPTAGLDDEIPF